MDITSLKGYLITLDRLHVTMDPRGLSDCMKAVRWIRKDQITHICKMCRGSWVEVLLGLIWLMMFFVFQT